MRAREPRSLDCPACGERTGQTYLYSKNGCDVLRCESCGLGRTQVTGFDPQSYYTDGYFSGAHADGYADYRGAEKVLRREFRHTADFVRRHARGRRLLELGCAYGFFLEEARRDFTVAGIEIAGDAAAQCRARGLDVVHGVADADTLARFGPQDAIVLLDVIEHLSDPLGTLDLCARNLDPGGIVVITTGDFGSAYARIAGPRWRLMTPPQHLWFFNRDSMDRLAGRLGLIVETFEHPWKIVPLGLAAFQLQRMLGFTPLSAPGSGIGIPVNLFDAMRVVMRKPS